MITCKTEIRDLLSHHTGVICEFNERVARKVDCSRGRIMQNYLLRATELSLSDLLGWEKASPVFASVLIHHATPPGLCSHYSSPRLNEALEENWKSCLKTLTFPQGGSSWHKAIILNSVFQPPSCSTEDQAKAESKLQKTSRTWTSRGNKRWKRFTYPP